MQRLILIMMLMLFASAFAFGQTDDEIKVGDYTAKIIQLENGKYVFDVLKGSTMIREKATRPFFTTDAPFIKKENALLISKWYLGELEKNNQVHYFLPIPKARDLGVSEEDLQFPKPNEN